MCGRQREECVRVPYPCMCSSFLDSAGCVCVCACVLARAHVLLLHACARASVARVRTCFCCTRVTAFGCPSLRQGPGCYGPTRPGGTSPGIRVTTRDSDSDSGSPALRSSSESRTSGPRPGPTAEARPSPGHMRVSPPGRLICQLEPEC